MQHNVEISKSKSFPAPIGYGVALVSVSIALGHTSVGAVKVTTGG